MDNNIDYGLIEDLYGVKFRNLREHLKINRFIDVNQRIKANHQYTSAPSIWYYGSGDFSFKNNVYGLIHIQTGCLDKVKGFRIPFGNEYYEEYTGENMTTYEEYTGPSSASVCPHDCIRQPEGGSIWGNRRFPR